jgi:acyl-CoA thioesterase-1
LLKSFKDLNLTVVNRGVSGETAAATAERMKMLVAMEKPTLVLWQVGTNDALSRVGVEEFDDTVRDTLRWLKSHKIDIVLVGLQYTAKAQQDEHYQAIRERLTKVATEEGVLLVRRFAAMQFLEKVKGQATLVGDDLHHNDFGYRCMAEHIARAMVVSSFLSRKRDAKEYLTR